jgi:Domain of unknown function (DUF1996)
MAYPIHIDGKLACPPAYPVAVPMLEFKIAFPVSGNLSHLRLSSGPASTWHYDFYNGWNPVVLAASSSAMPSTEATHLCSGNSVISVTSSAASNTKCTPVRVVFSSG